MKRQIFYIITVIVLALGCNKAPKPIKRNLNLRSIKYEIVDVKKDSSVYDSVMTFLNQIDSAITEMEKAKLAYSQVYMKIPIGDDVTSDIVKNQELALYDSLVTIIDTLYSKVHFAKNAQYEPCYYIKYTVLNGAVKDEYEEYFFLINKELKHRPVNFEEFLSQTTYKDLDDRLQELYHYLSNYRYEYSLRVK